MYALLIKFSKTVILQQKIKSMLNKSISIYRDFITIFDKRKSYGHSYVTF